MRFQDIVMVAAQGGGKPFTPLSLGATLLGYYDAESALSVPQSAGAVTTWTDPVTGYAPTQATAGKRPVWSATSFGGRPGVTFDGVDDQISGVTSPYPTGTLVGGVEFWLIVSQDALAGSTGSRSAVGYGNTATGGSYISSFRVVTTGVNRALSERPAGKDASNTSVDFSGIHAVRSYFSAAGGTIGCDVDAIAGSTTTAGNAITNAVFSIGSAVDSTAFWNGKINSIWITATLTAAQQAQMWAFARSRGTP